jgi:hypothetical protein
MIDVLYTCLTKQHDFRLVLLGGFLCIVGCFTATNLFVHAQEAAGKKRAGLAAAPPLRPYSAPRSGPPILLPRWRIRLACRSLTTST